MLAGSTLITLRAGFFSVPDERNEYELGIAPTGKHGIITGIDIYCITDGKIEEAWSNWDALRLLQEMGVIPPIG